MIIKERKQTRLKKYDYSDSGWYFVTICAQNRKCIFGEIVNNKMVLNEYGKIIDKYWLRIPKHFNNVELNEFIVMPNHVHGIIVIKNNFVGVSFMKPKINIMISKSNHHMGLMNQTPTLGLIVRYFKSKCTYELHKNGYKDNLWQRNYYDHIIRNEFDLNRVRQYIRYNPINWETDINKNDTSFDKSRLV